MRTYVLLGISILAGVAAFVIANRQIEQMEKELMGDARQLKVLVPKRDLTRGESIRNVDTDLTFREMYVKDLTETSPGSSKYKEITYEGVENVKSILGLRLAVDVDKQQPFRWSDFEGTGGKARRGFADTINKKLNHRALSISVDSTSSVSGLIQPNDHVDIVATFRFPSMGGEGRQLDTVTLTLLQNLTVLAVGQRYGGGSRASMAVRRSRGYTNLTLSVSAKEAEMLVFAQQKGHLTLTLRHPEDVYLEKKTQRVDFKYLEGNIKHYIEERARLMKFESRFRRP